MSESEFEFIQEAKADKPEQKWRFVIEYSHHCFTRGMKNEDRDDSTLHYADHRRDLRVFCVERYALSWQLPVITSEISKAACYHTGRGNFFIVNVLDEDGVTREYEVYFKVSKVKKGLLRLYVESAYVRDGEHGTKRPRKKKIKFFTIAKNIRDNKRIKPPQ